MNYAFHLILKEGTEITEELADQLFAAGCDDGTPVTFCGTPYVSFHREAESLESAIRSAVARRPESRLRCRASPDRARLAAAVVRCGLGA